MYTDKRVRSAILLAWAVLFLCPPAEAQNDAAAERYFTGNALYNRKMYKLAIEEYKLFLKENSGHAKADNARMGMAMSYYCLEQHKEAAPILKDLVAGGTTGDTRQLRRLLAQSLLQLGRMSEAEKEFETLVEGGTEGNTGRLALAGVLEARYAQNKWKEVVPAVEALLKVKPAVNTKKRALYQGGYAYYQLKKFNEAIPYLAKLRPMVKGEDLAPQVAFLLAESYRMSEKLDEAATLYAEAAHGFKGDTAAEIYYRLGFVQYVRGAYQASTGALQNCLKEAPEGRFSAKAYLYLGRCYVEMDDMDTAAKYLDAILDGTQKGPEGAENPIAEAALWRARTYSRSGEYGKAVAFITDVMPKIESSPLLTDLLFDQANSFIALKKYGSATNALKKVLDSGFRNQANDALRLYTVCLHHEGDFKTSLENANRFIATYKDDKLMHEILFVKAENLYFLNKYDEAKKTYSEFLKRYPEKKSAKTGLYRIVQIDHREGRWKEAIETASPLIEKRPRGELFSQLDFILGDCYFRLENWPAAIGRMNTFISRYPPELSSGKKQKEPNVDSALIELAVALVKQKKRDEAIGHLQTLVKQYPASTHLPLALSELGLLYYKKDDYDSARQALKKFVKVAPDGKQRPKVESYLGWIALSENKDAEAEKHFSVVAAKYGEHELAPEAYLQLGLVQLAQKKYAQAHKSLLKLDTSYPEKNENKEITAFSLGVCLARLKNSEKAIPYFRTVIKKYPSSKHAGRAFYELAWCEKQNNNRKAAADWYWKLIEAFPEDKLANKAKVELAESMFEEKNYDGIIALLKPMLDSLEEDDELSEDIIYRLGTAYFNKDRMEESIKTFDLFIRKFPGSKMLASAHFQAGESCMELKEMIRAREHFLAASKTEGMRRGLKEPTLLRLGKTQGLTEQWEESAATYSVFLEEYPESKWIRSARFGYGWALEKQGKYKAAMKAYGNVITGDKDILSARSQFQIGECLFALKEYDEAIKALIPLQVVYRYKDWAAKSLLETGRLMEAKGDNEAAMDQFKEVIKQFPDHNAAVVAKKRLDWLRTGGI